MQITLQVNGVTHIVNTRPDRTLLRVLREDLGLTGTKENCTVGECGGCTVLADGLPINACLLLAPSAQGMSITTIEGLAPEGELHPVQEAFLAADAVQCGFCTSGFIMAAAGLLRHNPDPSETEVRAELSGNLCRCTGYNSIVRAVRLAGERMRSAGEVGR